MNTEPNPWCADCFLRELKLTIDLTHQTRRQIGCCSRCLGVGQKYRASAPFDACWSCAWLPGGCMCLIGVTIPVHNWLVQNDAAKEFHSGQHYWPTWQLSVMGLLAVWSEGRWYTCLPTGRCRVQWEALPLSVWMTSGNAGRWLTGCCEQQCLLATALLATHYICLLLKNLRLMAALHYFSWGKEKGRK